MSFVYYRLPHTETIFRNRLDDEPYELYSFAELDGRKGFVIAPFCITEHSPLLLVPAEWEEAYTIDTEDEEEQLKTVVLENTDIDTERLHYNIDFNNYHAQLRDGAFAKIVLARQSKFAANDDITPMQLFLRACRRYPRMFITLFSTKRTGTWLIATPEILLKGNGSEFQTMALAGTMRLSGHDLGFDVRGSGIGKDDIHWSTKNIKEQRYVETYITECVEKYTSDFGIDGPYTSRAGDLVHLRSDIRFRLSSKPQIGNLLNSLHPTPAVCGMPKEATREFIMTNESAPRGYYSGFSGLIDPEGDTAIYVTLRCMKIEQRLYTMYAGGGLLADSNEQSEWEETVAKMNTMKQLFDNVQQ